MTRDQAKEKVKKLLRLGKSSNVHEAAAALRQAQALMRQHAIDERDVAERSPDDIGESSSEPRRGKHVPVDIVRLANLIAATFGVSIYWQSQGKFGFGARLLIEQRLVVVGPDSRRDLAIYAFDVLHRQLERDKRKHLSRVRKAKNRAARGDEFGIGWVIGVAAVLEPWATSADEQARIDAFMAQSAPDLVNSKVKARESKAVSFADRERGVHAGRNAELNRGVAGERQRALEGPSR